MQYTVMRWVLMITSWWLSGKHRLYWGWWECWTPLIEGRHMTHTHALLDWDCWIDRNPDPGDRGRWRGPGHVLPGASVGEEEGAENARSTGTNTLGRQGGHGSAKKPKVSWCLICTDEGDRACSHCWETSSPTRSRHLTLSCSSFSWKQAQKVWISAEDCVEKKGDNMYCI